MLAQVLAGFISEVIKDQTTASPNYTYILFEASALTLTYVKLDQAAFANVEA